ncbi:MAG: lysine--tRNA ligase [Bdellovibrionales bacterium]|nr:lysine--tRNA ligase [Bdellovibrionales bacterium]
MTENTREERPEQEQVRFAKLDRLRESGWAFPNDVKVDAHCNDLLSESVSDPSNARRFTIAGRMVQQRLMGKASFVHLLDGSGKLQVYVRKDDVGSEQYDEFKTFDLGDILEVRGYLFDTKTGERTLYAESVRLLTKCLVPLPEKFHGLADVEARYRQRYLDLISNPEGRDTFRKRAAIIQGVREFLNDQGYLEVETPVLHHHAEGAEARPFKTHHNALDSEMVLRIALELPLKKLVVGGLERVYEIGRVFRNEGLSKKHNPEFTMLEFYQAYATFEDLMTLTENLLRSVVQKVLQRSSFQYGDHEIDLSKPFLRISMLDSVHELGGISRDVDLTDLREVQKILEVREIECEDPNDWGRGLEALWDELVEPKLIQPTFITHHPRSISPLSRANSENPQVVDRFELIVCGMELANAFSELNDPEDQRERFLQQARAKGEEHIADDFVRALEYGLPPTGGEGIGIDRLVMLLTNSQTIRDILLFPQLRQREENRGEGELPSS